MKPIDVLVVVSAALSVFYLPFLSARLVMWLLFGRRPQTRGVPRVVLDLTTPSRPRPVPEPIVSSEVLMLPGAAPEVLDLNELFHYLSDQRASDAEALLTQFLHQDQLASPQR